MAPNSTCEEARGALKVSVHLPYLPFFPPPSLPLALPPWGSLEAQNVDCLPPEPAVQRLWAHYLCCHHLHPLCDCLLCPDLLLRPCTYGERGVWVGQGCGQKWALAIGLAPEHPGGAGVLLVTGMYPREGKEGRGRASLAPNVSQN